jgi:hypothetical protein
LFVEWRVMHPSEFETEVLLEKLPDQERLADSPSSVDGHEFRLVRMQDFSQHFLLRRPTDQSAAGF